MGFVKEESTCVAFTQKELTAYHVIPCTCVTTHRPCTHVAYEGLWGKNLLNQTVFHIQIGIKGLVLIHNLPTFDQKAVALVQTKRWILFLHTELLNTSPWNYH
jgi:hypothetical protein